MNTSNNANFTQSQVSDAISTLSTRGDTITTRSGLALIGHGSYTTINKHLGVIRTSEYSNLAPEKMLTALPDHLRSIISEIYFGARRSLKAEADIERQKIKSLKHASSCFAAFAEIGRGIIERIRDESNAGLGVIHVCR
jgi:hypothetical protein